MSYSDAVRFLYELRWFGAKFGLQNTFRLAELAGNPQKKLRFIHVAGTNGKGSTCAMLESIYRHAGLRVGLFTSPHLVAFCERIQVNRRFIPEDEVARLVAAIKPLLSQFSNDQHPTFFEVVTVMALLYFAAQNCDLVIWETGLGGRLDATNIVQPIASVITNIQYDHQKYLGESLASIAGEKAGIIKPGVPSVTGTEAPEALAVLTQTAAQVRSPLTIVRPEEARRAPLDAIHLPLLGDHQKMNAAVALATVRVLQQQIPIDDETIQIGLSRVQWAGRLQVVTRASGQKILLDAAHNMGGAESFAAALKGYFAGMRPLLILGILQDKDWQHTCRILAPLSDHILLVPVHSERSAEPHGLAEVCRMANPQSRVEECSGLPDALAKVSEAGFVAIVGSLYLVGEAMEVLHLTAGQREGERSLNEWSVRQG